MRLPPRRPRDDESLCIFGQGTAHCARVYRSLVSSGSDPIWLGPICPLCRCAPKGVSRFGRRRRSCCSRAAAQIRCFTSCQRPATPTTTGCAQPKRSSPCPGATKLPVCANLWCARLRMRSYLLCVVLVLLQCSQTCVVSLG